MFINVVNKNSRMISNVDSKQGSLTDTNDAFQQCLLRWSMAIRYFYCLHTELGKVIDRGRNDCGSGAASASFVGQCSMKQLRTLHTTMHQQLAHLMIDMDSPANEGNVDMLQAHCTLLLKWNKRVKRALYLASLPAC